MPEAVREITQQDRRLKVDFPFGPNKVVLWSMEGHDHLGELFEYNLELRSNDMNLSFTDVVGKGASIEMDLGDGKKRFFHGVVADFSFVGSEHGMACYRATLKPELWFLEHTTNCRIFQDKTAVDIIETILKDDHAISFRKSLAGTYPKRKYCVQYRESDFSFISRLMEQEGIFYFFEHESDKHQMVLVDRDSTRSPLPLSEAKIPYRAIGDAQVGMAHINDWRVRRTVVPKKVTLDDYDFKKPKVKLKDSYNVPGPQENFEGEIYDFPGPFPDYEKGTNYAKNIARAYGSASERFLGASNVKGIITGFTFELDEYPRGDQNDEYLVVGVQHRLESDDMYGQGGDSKEEIYGCEFEAVLKQSGFVPPRVTPKPFVRGPHTAVVVGKKGEEIECDEHGRVMVRFHWDREPVSKPEQRACWIRVAQAWAGKGWGSMHLPRVGHEVLVSFVEGDPDRPMITGSVYNAENTPHEEYKLPEHKTRSGITSRSTMKGTKENYNEIRFEDKKDEEQVYLQAEKDLETLVKNKEKRTVGATRETIIGDSDFDAEDRVKSLDKTVETVTLQGSREQTIEGGDIVKINNSPKVQKGRDTTILKGDDKLLLKMGDISAETKTGKIHYKAAMSIKLEVGSNTIEITPDAIKINGMMVTVQGTTKADLKSPMTTVSGDAMTTVKGGMVMIN